MMEAEPIRPVHELNRRQNDGLTVILWWLEGTLSTYVEVEDIRENERFIIETPEDTNAQEVFMHPFAYRGKDGAP